MTEVAGSQKPANQRCAAPCFLSQTASIPQQFSQRCRRNCTNPEVDTLIALYLHRLLATYIKLNLSLLMSFLMGQRMEEQFRKWKNVCGQVSLLCGSCYEFFGQNLASSSKKLLRFDMLNDLICKPHQIKIYMTETIQICLVNTIPLCFD